MNSVTTGLLIVFICIVVYRQIYNYNTVVIAGRAWKVSSAYENDIAAAELLARVNNRIIDFLRIMRRKYDIDNPTEAAKSGRFRAMMDVLLDNYNPDEVYENDPRLSSDTSYTLDKGRRMYICVRNRDNPAELVDEHTLMFVMLHELTHIANFDGWGHKDDFWLAFAEVLSEIKSTGLYDPVDYSKHPTVYCGLHINYSPYFDPQYNRAAPATQKK